MKTHLKKFETLAGFQSAQTTLDKPNVSLIEATMGVNYIPIPETITVTITASGWNSFSCGYALDLSTITDGTAYIASEVENGKLILTSTTAKVPAGTGLMINGTPNTEFTINITSNETTVPSNLLIGLPNGGLVPVAIEGYNYVFGWSNPEQPGWYKITSDAPTLGAGKSYLHTTIELTNTSISTT